MNNIRALRKEKNLTMKELGKMMGVAESTISMYENGYREPDTKTLIRLADFFNVSTDYLLGRTENAHDPLSGWTEEEKAAGVGRHPTYLSEDEINWLELRSEILRVYGEKNLSAVVTMLEAWVNKNQET